MHALRRGIVGKMSGIAALCAIMLLSFAPLASQLIAHSRLDALLGSFCAAGIKDIAHDAHASRHHAPPQLQACGYCDLVTHAPTPPVLTQHGAVFAASRAPYSIASTIDAPYAAPRRDALARAPPAFA